MLVMFMITVIHSHSLFYHVLPFFQPVEGWWFGSRSRRVPESSSRFQMGCRNVQKIVAEKFLKMFGKKFPFLEVSGVLALPFRVKYPGGHPGAARSPEVQSILRSCWEQLLGKLRVCFFCFLGCAKSPSNTLEVFWATCDMVCQD